ncbi:lipase [Microthyrium microscopicum]|uniref:Carboxylic ester hydrolase n=1 Tax=Microthyrium microscopicum TaxID=703497 RepID=A0A6A6UI69_9PEZI|nr:lipase [Microthyrium microscopicum]
MLWFLPLLLCSVARSDEARLSLKSLADQPTVTISNGTIAGKYLSQWKQDAFLGIPYAQPPIGNLRFRHPKPLDKKWDTPFQATKFGKTCQQYGSRTDLSEDCLVLNVFRPSQVPPTAKLPVFVIIYGGGFTSGSSAEDGYNPAALIAHATSLSQPFIAVSMNYRLGVWGFLSTPEILKEGSTNAGLMDQRLAFQWVQENIGAFGGDAKRVTIWGVSAGAQSIGLHLHSFGGKDEGLYQGAIMESGGPVGTALQEMGYYKGEFDRLVKEHGCDGKEDRLACLRGVSESKFYEKKGKVVWNPIVDGNVLTDWPSEMAKRGEFVKIPLITGANTDEGSNFSNRKAKSDEEISTWLKTWRDYTLTSASIKKIVSLYENYDWPPYSAPKSKQYPNTGARWRKSGAIGGDIVMMAQRRKVAEQYTKAGQNAWSFRFDASPWNSPEAGSVRHGDEVDYVFQNISGKLGPAAKYQSHHVVAESIGTYYVNFINKFDPNPTADAKGSLVVPKWPSYKEEAVNMVFNATKVHTEKDDWRAEGISFINSITRQLLA